MKHITAIFFAALIAAASLQSCNKTHYYHCHCWYYDSGLDSFLWEQTFIVESEYSYSSGYDATALCYDAYGGAGGINSNTLGCYDAVPMDKKAAKEKLGK